MPGPPNHHSCEENVNNLLFAADSNMHKIAERSARDCLRCQELIAQARNRIESFAHLDGMGRQSLRPGAPVTPSNAGPPTEPMG